jgi:hypothetical protein
MENYKDKRSGGYNSRGGKKERSYGDFNGEYRKRTRPRFNREDERPQYVKIDRREDGENRERSNSRRYGSDVSRYNSDDRPRTRYNSERRQGGYNHDRRERNDSATTNNGNYSRNYSTQHRSGYSQNNRSTSSYDPNA